MKKSSSILLLAAAWFYIATPLNAQWVRVQGTIPFNVAVRAFAGYTNGSGERILFAGTEGAGIFLSKNDGSSWTAVNNGLTDLTVYSLTINGTNIFAGTEIGGVFRSTNNGTSWSAVNAGFTGSEIYSFAVSDTHLYAGAFWGGVFRSTDDGNSWSNSGLYYVLSLLKTDGYLYAGTGASQVWRSTDNGSSWLPSGSGLLYTTYNTLAMTSEGNLFAGSYWDSSGVFLSTDNGVNWNQFNVGLTNKQVYALVASGSNLFAGTGFLGGVFLLTSINSRWIPVNEGFAYPFFITSLGISGDYIFAGALGYGVWRRPLSDFIPVELTSFAATVNDDNVELSWITATETNNQGFEVERSQKSQVKGQMDWEKIGFVEGHGTTTESQAYFYLDKNVATGKYKYRLKQKDYDGTFEYSNVVEVEVTSPLTFSLEQNYPNPFNPSTKIKYIIPNVETHRDASLQMVTLKVYDVLGNEVATLVNEEKPAGSYEVEFSASNLPSGTYFYQLKASSLIETKKMILLK
jgi:photosystem II stability/assembly factor-like uncharacterized protein